MIMEFNTFLGCEVVACSIDSHFSHMEFAKKPRNEGGLGQMQIPMLADLTKEVGKKYGCLTKDESIHLRATYIIDGKGILRHAQLNDT